MNVQFIGATGTVTGSKYLVTVDQKRYLVDCGLFQGLKTLRLRNWNPLPIDPKSIDAVILTHAHIDHSGYIPVLTKAGFKGKILCTPATKSLCDILLPDAGHLQEEEAEYANKRRYSKHHPALPLYTEDDARDALKLFQTVPWKAPLALDGDNAVEFLPAGHILGASIVRFRHCDRTLTFTGDLGRFKDSIMPPPTAVSETDYLVVESTYGNRRHSPEDPRETLKKIVNETVGRGGIVLIPAFAVGRAQQILHILGKLKKAREIPDIPVFLNSPMAVQSTRLTCDFSGELVLSEGDCMEICEVARYVTTAEESKKLNDRNEPCVIISASGMATGGRVLHHLKKLAPNPKNAIVFAGFQAAGTRGEAMAHGAETVKIHGEAVPIRASVHVVDTLSAHADADEILNWLKNFVKPPKMTFITHGEPDASEELRKKIEQNLRWPCKIPNYLDLCDLT